MLLKYAERMEGSNMTQYNNRKVAFITSILKDRLDCLSLDEAMVIAKQLSIFNIELRWIPENAIEQVNSIDDVPVRQNITTLSFNYSDIGNAIIHLSVNPNETISIRNIYIVRCIRKYHLIS